MNYSCVILIASHVKETTTTKAQFFLFMFLTLGEDQQNFAKICHGNAANDLSEKEAKHTKSSTLRNQAQRNELIWQKPINNNEHRK